MVIKPLISIIVPNYNHATFLQQRLDSIFKQTFQDFEVILLDDCSTDNSVELLNNYANNKKVSHFVVNKKNSGSPFKQWEKGMELAKGDFIWIAESDDFCELNFLEKIMQQYKKVPSLGLVYSQTIDVSESNDKIYHRIDFTQNFKPNIWEEDFVLKGEQFVTSYLSVKNVIPNASGVVFKKELVYNNVFSKTLLDMRMCGDWFFWIQLSLKTEIGFISSTLNYFRNHQNVSRNHATIAIKKRRLFEEKEVRNFLNQKGFKHKKQEKNLYNQWFRLFSWKSLFKKEFYSIKLSKTSTLKLLTYFSIFKLVKRKLW